MAREEPETPIPTLLTNPPPLPFEFYLRSYMRGFSSYLVGQIVDGQKWNRAHSNRQTYQDLMIELEL